MDIKQEIARVSVRKTSLGSHPSLHSKAVTHAERNLSFVSTLQPWAYQINNSNDVNEIFALLPSLMHTLFLVWQHSQ